MLFGAIRNVAWYIGSANNTDLIRITLPHFVSQYPPQAVILDFILLMISLHNDLLLKPFVMGRPRYFILSQWA